MHNEFSALLYIYMSNAIVGTITTPQLIMTC